MNKSLLALLIIIISASVMYLISGYMQTRIIFPPPSSPTGKYQCPKTEWINCMPGPGKRKLECNPQYLRWAQENCSGFKGAVI